MVQDLIQQGYSGPQISEYFEIATATFYRHFIEKYGVRFADYKKKITKKWVLKCMGRHELPIDWTKVDKLIEAQNTAC